MLWGHRNDPVNFHRCLQDFDRRLPDLLAALRPGRPADHHVRPRLRSDDAVDRPLTRARAAPRLRRGQERRRPDPRGIDVRRRRRDRERLARRQGAGPRDSRRADRRAVIRPAELIERKRDGGPPDDGRDHRADPRPRARRRARLPDGRVLHGRLLPGAHGGGDARAHGCVRPQRVDARPTVGSGPLGRGQALDGGRRGQDLARRRRRSWRRAACRSGR